jgi:Ca2+-transporting ATPase
MERPPRPVSDSPFALARLVPSMLQGLGVAAALLGGHVWMLHQGWPELAARSVVFAALLLSVMGLILAHRDRRRAAMLNAVGRNPWLWRMQAGVGLLLLAVLGAPWLNGVLRVSWPAPAGWLAIAALVALGALWLELLRWVVVRPFAQASAASTAPQPR